MIRKLAFSAIPACALLFATSHARATLSYGGGAVQVGQKVYVTFWHFLDSSGALYDPNGVRAGIETMFNSNESAPWEQVVRQYYGTTWGCPSCPTDYAAAYASPLGEGPANTNAWPDFGNNLYYGQVMGVWLDQDMVNHPANVIHSCSGAYCIDPNSITTEVNAMYSKFGQAPSSENLYVLILPGRVWDGDGACADPTGCPISFCDDGDPVKYPGCSSLYDGIHKTQTTNTIVYALAEYTGALGSMQEESVEAMTDTLGPPSGWTQSYEVTTTPPTYRPDEIVDICRDTQGLGTIRIQSEPSNVPAPYTYIVPQMSNRANCGNSGCVYRYQDTYYRTYVNSAGQLASGTSSTGVSPPDYPLQPLSASASIMWAYNHTDYFALDTNGNVRHSGTGSSTWDTFQPITNFTFYSAPEVASWGNSNLTVMVSVTSAFFGNRFLQKQYDASTGWVPSASNNWTQFTPPYTIASKPAITSWGVDDPSGIVKRLDLFYTDSSGILRTGWSTDGGSTWSWGTWPLSNPSGVLFTGDPDATSPISQRLDVVVVGNNGHMYHSAYAYSTFWGWDDWGTPPGVTLRAGPTVTQMGDNRLHAEATDSNGAIWGIDYDCALSTWYATGLGGSLKPSVTAY